MNANKTQCVNAPPGPLITKTTISVICIGACSSHVNYTCSIMKTEYGSNSMNTRSYRSPARDQAADLTRSRIINAAVKILGDRSKSAKFSLEVAARAAGVTRLTIYNQFGSRRALLEAVFDDRAARGGLHRIAEAMADGNPRVGLQKLIEIFCNFWTFDAPTLGWLHGAGAFDADMSESVRARNERRRKALSVLVRRIAPGAGAREAAGLVDVLFALTSFHFVTELRARGRSIDDVCALIQRIASDTLSRFVV